MFGEKLKLLRREMKLTQKELAEKLGISPSTIGMYEQGRRAPDINTINIISHFFSVTADYLIGNHQETKISLKDQKEISYILSKIRIALEQHYVQTNQIPIAEETIRTIISAIQAES